MNFEEFDNKYDDLINQVPDYDCTPKKAEELSTKFFKATYEVNKLVKVVRNQIILLEQSNNLAYKEAIENAVGKNVTEKKISAESDKKYRQTYKELKEATNSLEYFRSLFKIFENGHIFYKQLTRV